MLNIHFFFNSFMLLINITQCTEVVQIIQLTVIAKYTNFNFAEIAPFFNHSTALLQLQLETISEIK